MAVEHFRFVRGRDVTNGGEQLRRECLNALRSDAALSFLAQLMYELTRAARDEYGPEGTMPPGSEFALRCFNEMLHRTSMQMRKVLGTPDAGYPDDVYLNMLDNEANVGERPGVLTSVLTRAVEAATSPSP